MFPGTVSIIKLSNPTSNVRAMWLCEDLEFMSFQIAHSLRVFVNYSSRVQDILLNDSSAPQYLVCSWTREDDLAQWVLGLKPALELERRIGILRIPNHRRIIHPLGP